MVIMMALLASERDGIREGRKNWRKEDEWGNFLEAGSRKKSGDW